MDSAQEPKDNTTLKLLEERIDSLQRKVSELLEQQKDIETQVNHYRALLRQYRAVFEAESLGMGYVPSAPPTPISGEGKDVVNTPAIQVPKGQSPVTPAGGPIRSVFKAVLVIMIESKGQPLHGTVVHERVTERYSSLAADTKAKNLYTAVVAALSRGARQGLYERLEPNVYRMRPRGD